MICRSDPDDGGVGASDDDATAAAAAAAAPKAGPGGGVRCLRLRCGAWHPFCLDLLTDENNMYN
jgi:hypothetical protein